MKTNENNEELISLKKQLNQVEKDVELVRLELKMLNDVKPKKNSSEFKWLVLAILCFWTLFLFFIFIYLFIKNHNINRKFKAYEYQLISVEEKYKSLIKDKKNLSSQIYEIEKD